MKRGLVTRTVPIGYRAANHRDRHGRWRGPCRRTTSRRRRCFSSSGFGEPPPRNARASVPLLIPITESIALACQRHCVAARDREDVSLRQVHRHDSVLPGRVVNRRKSVGPPRWRRRRPSGGRRNERSRRCRGGRSGRLELQAARRRAAPDDDPGGERRGDKSSASSALAVHHRREPPSCRLARSPWRCGSPPSPSSSNTRSRPLDASRDSGATTRGRRDRVLGDTRRVCLGKTFSANVSPGNARAPVSIS